MLASHQICSNEQHDLHLSYKKNLVTRSHQKVDKHIIKFSILNNCLKRRGLPPLQQAGFASECDLLEIESIDQTHDINIKKLKKRLDWLVNLKVCKYNGKTLTLVIKRNRKC